MARKAACTCEQCVKCRKRARRRAWYYANRDYDISRVLEWKSENRERINEYVRARRALEVEAAREKEARAARELRDRRRYGEENKEAIQAIRELRRVQFEQCPTRQQLSDKVRYEAIKRAAAKGSEERGVADDQ